jgi:hypothetical protein
MQKKTNSKKKISVKKVTPKSKSKKIPKNPNVEKVLIENFIALQKVMTNLAMKFDGLNIQISKLLELFEISAKTLAKKDITLNKGQSDPKMVDKLDTLLDQNKIIARSLTLLHEIPESMPQPRQIPQPIPQARPPQQLMRQPTPSQNPPMSLQSSPVKQMGTNGYQKSISTKKQESPSPKPAG